jgi:predicted acylesterase/phospholipase RssA
MFFTYAYLLRVPIAAGLLLGAFAPFALWKGSQVTTLLEGMFDLDWWRTAIATVMTLLAASACAICSEMVLRYGSDRFGVPALPGWTRERLSAVLGVPIDRLSGGIALVCALCAASMLAGLVYAGADHLTRAGGVLLGLLAYVALLLGVMRVWASSDPTAVPPAARLFAWTPAGYVQSAAQKTAALTAMEDQARRRGEPVRRTVHYDRDLLLPGHAFAVVAFLVTVVVYATLGLGKWWFISGGRADTAAPPLVPTLAAILLLLTLLTYLLAGVAFMLDRFRVPFVVPVLVLMVFAADWPQSDHFFELRPAQPVAVSPAEVLAQSADASAVVVAASGGGIQAAAWTATVLSRLHAEVPGDVAHRIRVISAVSGGSVGTMYFVDAFDRGTLDATTLRARVFEPAAASSLDDIAWGFVYPDFLRLFAPFASWMDRGHAAEMAWSRFGRVTELLSSWRPDTRAARRPAVLFNATAAENGSRVVLGTTDLQQGLRGRMDFYDVYAGHDVPIVTAVRLSASFPYVSPAARAAGPLPVSKTFHFVDGGYYDNFGISSLADWLLEAMPLRADRVTRILLVQIRGPIGATDPVATGRRRGALYQALAPLATVARTRATGQISHNNAELRLLCEVARGRGVTLDTAVFQYPDPDTPLSWHLTVAEKDAVWRAYGRCQDRGRPCEARVRDFVGGARDPEGCRQFEEPPRPAAASAAGR